MYTFLGAAAPALKKFARPVWPFFFVLAAVAGAWPAGLGLLAAALRVPSSTCYSTVQAAPL